MQFEDMLRYIIIDRDSFARTVMGTEGAEHVARFQSCDIEGVCPECGEQCEAHGGDEGPANDHWLEHGYECPKCGRSFTERFACVPLYFTFDD